MNTVPFAAKDESDLCDLLIQLSLRIAATSAVFTRWCMSAPSVAAKCADAADHVAKERVGGRDDHDATVEALGVAERGAEARAGKGVVHVAHHERVGVKEDDCTRCTKFKNTADVPDVQHGPPLHEASGRGCWRRAQQVAQWTIEARCVRTPMLVRGCGQGDCHTWQDSRPHSRFSPVVHATQLEAKSWDTQTEVAHPFCILTC